MKKSFLNFSKNKLQNNQASKVLGGSKVLSNSGSGSYASVAADNTDDDD